MHALCLSGERHCGTAARKALLGQRTERERGAEGAGEKPQTDRT